MKTNSELRKRIRERLKTDDDLDAFCLDYFPIIKKLFTNGMTRTAKETFIIELADPEALESLLWQASVQPTSNQQLATCEHATKAEIIFRQINYVFTNFNDLLNYDLAINAAGEMLPSLANGDPNLGYKNSLKQLEKLTVAFDEVFTTCRKACIEASFWLTDEDNKVIESYLNRFSSPLGEVKKNISMINNLAGLGNASFLILLNTNKLIQQYRFSMSVVEMIRKDIEQRLRGYSRR